MKFLPKQPLEDASSIAFRVTGLIGLICGILTYLNILQLIATSGKYFWGFFLVQWIMVCIYTFKFYEYRQLYEAQPNYIEVYPDKIIVCVGEELPRVFDDDETLSFYSFRGFSGYGVKRGWKDPLTFSFTKSWPRAYIKEIIAYSEQIRATPQAPQP